MRSRLFRFRIQLYYGRCGKRQLHDCLQSLVFEYPLGKNANEHLYNNFDQQL